MMRLRSVAFPNLMRLRSFAFPRADPTVASAPLRDHFPVRLPTNRCRRQELAKGIGSPMSCTTGTTITATHAPPLKKQVLLRTLTQSETIVVLAPAAGATDIPTTQNTSELTGADSQTYSLWYGNALLARVTYRQLILITRMLTDNAE